MSSSAFQIPWSSTRQIMRMSRRPLTDELSRTCGLSVGGQQHLPGGGQLKLPGHGHLVTQRADAE
jgi:hypothetical protein